MSKYTTGEMAKLCSVTVRTVQYYDSRGILTPSELSEGGRRLYSDSDLTRLKIICFLRDAGMSIDSIGRLFSEDNPCDVISLLLDEQSRILDGELRELEERRARVAMMKRELGSIENFTVESIADMAILMKNRKKLRKMRGIMLALGFVMDAVEVATMMIWIFKGIWLPFAIGMAFCVALGVGISVVYFKKTAFICPTCHTVFRSGFRETFFAYHTPRTRRLTCPQCGRHGLCVETFNENDTGENHAENQQPHKALSGL